MPTRLLLEGNDIQALLAQVRDEHGPTAKIIAADRVRNAGLTGLFSKQRYELTIEVADAPPDGPTGPTDPADPTGPAGGRPNSGPGAPRAISGYPGLTTTGPSAAASLLALVEAQEDLLRASAPTATPEHPAPSPAAPSQPAPSQGAAPTLEDAMSAARLRRRPRTAPPAEPTTADPTATEPAEATVAATRFAEVLAGFSINPTAPAEPIPPADFAVTPTTRFATITTEPLDPPAPARAREAEAATRPAIDAATAETEPKSADAPPAPRVRPYRPDDPSDRVRASLAGLGMPADLLDQITDSDSYLAVVRLMESLPAAPAAPADAGDVLIVVGELAGAVTVAGELGTRLGLAPARTLVAAATTAGTGVHASRRLSGPAHAARRVARLRDAEGPLIVVVDAPADGTGGASARSMIEALDPKAVWAVVDATRKAADTERYLASFGRVDALAVRSVSVTTDPATVLALGLPVALLDGEPATPHLWAALLCRRIAEARASRARNSGARTSGARTSGARTSGARTSGARL